MRLCGNLEAVRIPMPVPIVREVFGLVGAPIPQARLQTPAASQPERATAPVNRAVDISVLQGEAQPKEYDWAHCSWRNESPEL